jgi:hypothetical protein
MLLSRKALQRVLGVLWLIDGLLQLQPRMFTGDMINGVMRPMLQGQPALLESSLQYIVTQTTLHLVEVNLLIAFVQIILGLCFLSFPDRWVKELVIASFVWAFVVWYGGEGLSMLLTGTSGILSGAPGAVLFYPLLGLAIWPRKRPRAATPGTVARTRDDGLLSRWMLRRVLSGFWFFAALLQAQPYWWQPGQIAQTSSALLGNGGIDTVLVDPTLTWFSRATANLEIPLNITLIVVFLAIGIGLAVPGDKHLRPFLIASIVVSLLIWYFSQGFGAILSGMATDFNSGLLLVVMALAVWPRVGIKQSAHARYAHKVRQAYEESKAESSV